LPFCCLRNFTFFGINITKTLKYSDQLSVNSGQLIVAPGYVSTVSVFTLQPTFSKTANANPARKH